MNCRIKERYSDGDGWLALLDKGEKGKIVGRRRKLEREDLALSLLELADFAHKAKVLRRALAVGRDFDSDLKSLKSLRDEVAHLKALINTALPTETNEYVFTYLLSQYFNLRAEAVGGNQPNLNLSIIDDWEIPIPPSEEQREIVRRVELFFKLADAIEKRVAAATLRVERLTHAILAKAF